MIEFVLAATMMYAGDSGELKSFQFSGRYRTHQACFQALTDKIALWKETRDIVITPVGTVCLQEKVPAQSKALPFEGMDTVCEATAAAAAAAGLGTANSSKTPSTRPLNYKESAAYKDCMSRKGNL